LVRVLVRDWFRRFAQRSAVALGTVPAFVAAVVIIIVWLITGPIFHFSDTWQLVINTGTTVVTFLMVFLIQNTQNRETRSLQLKIDELLRAVSTARTGFVHLEELSDAELDRLHAEFEKLGGEISELKERKKRAATSQTGDKARNKGNGKR
jgi:low affinity Fe/Cu permease